MTVVNPKSISGINSITTGSGSDDVLTIHNNNGTERLRIDSTGTTKIVTGIVTTLTATTGIVTTLTANTVTSLGAISGTTGTFTSDVILSSTGPKIVFTDSNNDPDFELTVNGGAFTLTDTTNSADRLKIDSSGRVGLGINPSLSLHVYHATNNGILRVESGDSDARIDIKDNSGEVKIHAIGDALTFNTSSSDTERVRIESSGGLRVGSTGILIDHAGNGTDYETCSIKRASQGVPLTIQTSNVSGGFPVMYLQSLSATATQNAVTFLRNVSGNPITVVGIIQTTASSTSYGTSSDYRLKENEVLISDGITRLKTLKPYRFNWKIDPSTKVDGFFAHEVTAVPEAVSGTKDEVSTDENGAIPKGDPIYQTIDHSKLVPLLTAALQEAITRIETLESEVAALKSS